MNTNNNDDDDWGWGNDTSSTSSTNTNTVKTIENPKLPIEEPKEQIIETPEKKTKKNFNIENFKTFLYKEANKSKALGEYLKLFIQYKLEEANDKPEKVYKQINLELPFSMIHLPKGPAVIQWKSWMENVDNIYNDLYKDVFAPFGNKFPRGIKLVSGLVMDKRNTFNRFNMSKTNSVSVSQFHGTLHNCLGTNIKPEDIFGEYKN